MTDIVRQASGLLLINENMSSLVDGMKAFLRKELAYLQDRRPIEDYSDLVTAANSVAGEPVPVQIPIIATATVTTLANGPKVTLRLDDAGLLTIARAIAAGVDILPATFLVSADDAVALLWRHPNAFVMDGAGVPIWTSDLQQFRLRVVQDHPGIIDLIVDSSASGMRLRAVAGETLQVGADDESPQWNDDQSPLPRENLAAFIQEGFSHNSSSFIIESLAPANEPLEELGHPDSHVLRKVFGDALMLECQRPVEVFVAHLPETTRAVINTLQRSPQGHPTKPLSLDALIRCLYIVGDLDPQQLADLEQAMEAIPLVRGLFAGLAHLSWQRVPGNIEIDLSQPPTLRSLDDFRSSIVGRESAHRALSVLLGDLCGLAGPVRPATLRALVQRAALPPIETVYALDAFHRTFPKAAGCTVGEIGNITDCLFHLQVEDFLNGDKFTDLATAVAPCLRPSAHGLTYDEAGQLNDVVEWVRDCLETLASDSALVSYGCQDFFKAAFSIVFAPKTTPHRVRSIIARWHAAIDHFETKTFSAEISASRFAARLSTSAFPHFLKGEAKVDFGGVPATVTPITTIEALFEEGRAMDNCVSSLRYTAASGHSLLVSVKTDAARSTAEFRPTPTGYRLIRHEGVHSSAADPVHERIVRSLEQMAMSAPYAKEMLPTLVELSKLEQIEPVDFMSDDEFRAYKDLVFSQLAKFLTPSERRLRREVWTSDLLPLHVDRFKDPALDIFPTPTPFLGRMLAAVDAATDPHPFAR